MQVAIDIADKVVIDEFHRLGYHHRGLVDWMGTPAYKLPSDLLLYQSVIHHTRPDVVIETGTFFGGSALFLAHMMDLVDHGQVITIDTEDAPGYSTSNGEKIVARPPHPRIRYVRGDSVEESKRLNLDGKSVMVILDSDHSKAHVLKELAAYAPLVTFGQYLVVEDTNINGHPVEWGGGDGPYEAVEEFDPTAQGFEDQELAKVHLITYHTWFVKTKEAPCLKK